MNDEQEIRLELLIGHLSDLLAPSTRVGGGSPPADQRVGDYTQQA